MIDESHSGQKMEKFKKVGQILQYIKEYKPTKLFATTKKSENLKFIQSFCCSHLYSLLSWLVNQSPTSEATTRVFTLSE